MHVVPKGFHRIRHYGLFANGVRAANLAKARELLGMKPPTKAAPPAPPDPDAPRFHPDPCPCCGGRMHIIEIFGRGCEPRHRPSPIPPRIRIDTS